SAQKPISRSLLNKPKDKGSRLSLSLYLQKFLVATKQSLSYSLVRKTEIPKEGSERFKPLKKSLKMHP
ncbi:MAG: hypothetical protein AAFO83_06490, partial [Cyanobacteria bacterium J06607_13]